MPVQRDEPRPFTAAGGGIATFSAPSEEGKLASFSGNAYTGAPMRPEMWWHPVIIDLDGVRVPSQHRPVLRQHDHEQIVGHTEEVKVDASGILVKGVFSGEKQHVDKVAVPGKNGFQWQMSIGANPVRTEFLDEGKETQVNGRTVTGPLTISRETELGEVSFVPLGADGATSAKVSASKAKGKIMKPFHAALKQLMSELRAAGKVQAAKYTDEEIDEMDADKAKAALKKCMKAADDEEGDEKKKEEDKKEEDKKSESAKAKSAMESEFKSIMDAMRKSAAAEYQRESDIAAAVRRHGVTDVEVEEDGAKKTVALIPYAIAKGWSTEKAELAALRAARPGPGVGIGVPGGLGYATTRPDITEAVLEAAVFHAGRHEYRLEDPGFYVDEFRDNNGNVHSVRRVPHYIQKEVQRDISTRYTDQVQQAAHTAFRGRMSLQRLLVASARLNGYYGSDKVDDGNGSEVLRFAAGSQNGGMRIQAEGPSTASIANILANVLNKFMLQGYLFVEQAWREVSAIRPVNDFKPTKSINLLADVMFQQVPNTGELQDAALGDQAFANQADQYGRILTISRKNIINDDLGILTGAPMKLGQGAGLKLNNLFWTTFLALSTINADDGNPFWNSTGNPATHGTAPNGQVAAGPNVFSGGTSALSSASLQTAKQMFDSQLDPNGNPLGFDEAKPILLFPQQLWLTAMELVDPAALGLVYGGASAAKQPNINMWKGRFTPVMTRYLSNTNYTGNSTTAWYILFNPVALSVIETCFLNGVDTPTVQMASQDFQFDRLGMSVRGILDMGVNAQNFRGGIKSLGV
jgi:Caudovirus prohead serine protease